MLQHISVLPPRPGSSSSTAGRLPIPITCEPCAPVLAGGQFSPHEGGRIRLCSDRLHSRQHASDVLTHELVHAWDDRHFDMDWKNVRHIACTEVSHRFTSRSSSSFFFLRSSSISVCFRLRFVPMLSRVIAAGRVSWTDIFGHLPDNGRCAHAGERLCRSVNIQACVIDLLMKGVLGKQLEKS